MTTIKTAPYLGQLFLYLGSYFIFSDGCSTMAGAAATFAANELNMNSIYIILGILFVSIMVSGDYLCIKASTQRDPVVYASISLKLSQLISTFSARKAIVGCFVVFWIETTYNVKPKHILIAVLIAEGLLPVYAMVAMTQQWEFYVMAGVFGFLTGPQQAYTRSIYSSYIPAGHEAEYFAFYEVTDKGTAWLGPLVITIVK